MSARKMLYAVASSFAIMSFTSPALRAQEAPTELRWQAARQITAALKKAGRNVSIMDVQAGQLVFDSISYGNPGPPRPVVLLRDSVTSIACRSSTDIEQSRTFRTSAVEGSHWSWELDDHWMYDLKGRVGSALGSNVQAEVKHDIDLKRAESGDRTTTTEYEHHITAVAPPGKRKTVTLTLTQLRYDDIPFTMHFTFSGRVKYAPSSGLLPLHRWVRTSEWGRNDHYYTTDWNAPPRSRLYQGMEAAIYDPDLPQPVGTVPLFQGHITRENDYFLTYDHAVLDDLRNAGILGEVRKIGYVFRAEDGGAPAQIWQIYNGTDLAYAQGEGKDYMVANGYSLSPHVAFYAFPVPDGRVSEGFIDFASVPGAHDTGKFSVTFSGRYSEGFSEYVPTEEGVDTDCS